VVTQRETRRWQLPGVGRSAGRFGCRYVDYLPSDGFTTLNIISTVGAYLLGLSVLPFIYNVIRSYRYGDPAGADDPWGYANSLEWATSCPPPRHNFTDLPRIRSERPAFDLHHPHMVNR
jgi:cytochrome c oxidase subunit I